MCYHVLKFVYVYHEVEIDDSTLQRLLTKHETIRFIHHAMSLWDITIYYSFFIVSSKVKMFGHWLFVSNVRRKLLPNLGIRKGEILQYRNVRWENVWISICWKDARVCCAARRRIQKSLLCSRESAKHWGNHPRISALVCLTNSLERWKNDWVWICVFSKTQGRVAPRKRRFKRAYCAQENPLSTEATTTESRHLFALQIH